LFDSCLCRQIYLFICRAVIENLLKTIPSIFETNKTSEPVFGAAVKATLMALV